MKGKASEQNLTRETAKVDAQAAAAQSAQTEERTTSQFLAKVRKIAASAKQEHDEPTTV
ncbi:MAG TPA: hypothetical protein VMC81_05230 [Rhodocyclaceae bacterium]|nr:hypothetical protein [Rhodocyclaceae bacterium]